MNLLKSGRPLGASTSSASTPTTTAGSFSPRPFHSSAISSSPPAKTAPFAFTSNLSEGIGSFTLGEEKSGRGWLDYVQGATSILRGEGFALGGFDVLVQSDVPLGSGLSSSAALSISLFRALRIAFNLPLDDRRIAVLAQRVENQFVGAQVGIMDPMACSLATPGTALFLDTCSLTFESLPLPTAADLVVMVATPGRVGCEG